MPIIITCSNCQKRVKAPDSFAGRTVNCPNCQNPLSVAYKPAENRSIEPISSIVPTQEKFESDSEEKTTAASDPRQQEGSRQGLFVALGVTGGLLLAGLAVIGFFWAMNAQGPHESAQAKNDAVTETNKPDQSQPPREQDEPLDPEKLGQQKEKEQTQQKAEDIRRQQEAEQRKIEERRAGEERNLEQREKLLETLDAKKREEAAQLEEEVKKHQKDVADIGRKIAQIEKTLGISRKMVNGVMVENQTSNPLDPRVKQLQSQIGKLQKDQTTAKSEEADAKKKRDTRMAQLEQERRRILVKFPVQGDPELAEHKGFLYKSDELIKIKAFEDEHGTPQRAADYYIQSLLDSRVLEKAEFLRVSAVAPPAEALLYKGQLKAYKTAHYQVRYVSKAGLVNDREVYVSVFALEDGNWYVSPAMKKLEVLGGLK